MKTKRREGYIRGSRKDPPVSPTLFNILMDSLAERSDEIESTDLREEQLRLNMLADDVMLMTKNEDNLQNLVNVATKWANET